MIVEALVSLFRTVVEAVLELLPVVTVDAWEVGSWGVAGGIADAIFPWSSIVAAIGVMLAWMVVCHGYRLVLWVLGVIHVSGDGG